MADAKKQVPTDEVLKETKFKRSTKDVVKKIHQNYISEIGFKTRHLHVMPSEDHTVKDVLNPAYWANLTKTINQHDKLCLDWEDGSKYWELKVLDKGDNWVKVAPLTEKPVDFHGIAEVTEVALYDPFPIPPSCPNSFLP